VRIEGLDWCKAVLQQVPIEPIWVTIVPKYATCFPFKRLVGVGSLSRWEAFASEDILAKAY
jgi:hypothetical protein